MLFTLARHCNQSLKMSLWRPHWITLSPVSYFTSYSLSVMNKYSADIWLQLISKPWKIKRRMHRGGEMGIASSVVARFSSFSNTFYTEHNKYTFRAMFEKLSNWQAREGTNVRDGSRSIWELMRRKRETEGYWIYKMATGILPPYQVAIVTHDSAISYSLNVLVNRTFFLPLFCHFAM